MSLLLREQQQEELRQFIDEEGPSGHGICIHGSQSQILYFNKPPVNSEHLKVGSQTQVEKPRIQPLAGLEGSSVVTQLDPPCARQANQGLRVLTGFPGFPLLRFHCHTVWG